MSNILKKKNSFFSIDTSYLKHFNIKTKNDNIKYDKIKNDKYDKIHP